MTKQHRAFTLIELLVVIAIISILMSILIPVAKLGIENGRRATCRSNLRQIGAALYLYAGDPVMNGEFTLIAAREGAELSNQYPLPPHAMLLGGVMPTKGVDAGFVSNRVREILIDPKVWICPSDKVDGDNLEPVTPAVTIADIGQRNISYMYIAGHRLISSPENAAIAPMMCDEANAMERGDATPANMPKITDADNHGAEYRNVLYLDGHVAAIQNADAANSIFTNLVNTDILQSID
ncbi:MAG TPA: prepilin-type N-terminal cleavage/methylation domain-containing protein [Kiritimatiellia bacterium]|nr:prepilin-type N-terminal cleavage/methylation domain-containing protein [Kiritimatiellia bacterium]HRZ13806.1 prepilin-type N-terminal cleavage/methylation domain-containing protein [Kiritimatiellia bacterium]HSA19427.1 prepilin-type N-terminal cleavage/methylation domain-containing protein [Kiritimatiellia bacterium]